MSFLFFEFVVFLLCLFSLISVPPPDNIRIQVDDPRLILYDLILSQLLFDPAYPLPCRIEFFRQHIIGHQNVILFGRLYQVEKELQLKDPAFCRPDHDEVFIPAAILCSELCIAVVS